MPSFRNWRGWVAALVLLPATALTIDASVGSASGAQPQGGSAAFGASSRIVKPNEKITLRGRFRPLQTATAGVVAAGPEVPATRSVKIQFRAFGSKYWRDSRRTRAGQAGRFSERIPVKRSGRFRAVSADGRTTRPRKVRVRSVTRARAPGHAKVGRNVKIRGHVSPAGTRRKVTVRVGGEKLHTRTTRSGGFAATWKPRRAGTSKVRVRAKGNMIAAGSKARAGRVSVFRPAVASYYGPGLYGGPLACGGRLGTSTVGVAHKTLPCGTKLTIRYKGRQVRTKVIDRGPYVAGREFDLTSATKAKLGFGSTGTILVDK